MTSDTETADKLTVSPADIRISEGGAVEIVNVELSDRLKAAVAEGKIKWPKIDIFCPENWKCTVTEKKE